MKLKNYNMQRTVFLNSEISMYYAEEMKNQEPVMVRVLSTDEEDIRDNWYSVYENYQMTVSNYKYLPRVQRIDLEENKIIVELETLPGKSLFHCHQLSKSQMEELLDAVHHLHNKGFIHGNITPSNIWITDEGNIILYGAGEWKIGSDNKSRLDDLDALKQLFMIFSEVTSIRKKDLNIKTFENIDDFYPWLTDEQPEKPGIVEKNIPIINVPNIVSNKNSNTQPKKRVDLNPPTKKHVNPENVVAIVRANLFYGLEAVGGKLKITNYRLIFEPHSLNFSTRKTEIRLEQISRVGLKNTLSLIPNGLLIETDAGNQFKFVVWKRKELMETILNLKKGVE